MTISNIVTETVKGPFLKAPSSEEDQNGISQTFEEVWSFPNAVGAMDGKHIPIEYPKLSGTLYDKYKGVYSIVLLHCLRCRLQFYYV